MTTTTSASHTPHTTRVKSTAFEYLIDNVMPTREVHLFAGPSGAGKTTLLLQMIQTWRSGADFFGHKCRPAPFLYISCDRSRNSVLRTFKRVGVEPSYVPFFSAISEPGCAQLPIESLLLRACRTRPNVRVLFIDGLGSKVPGGKIIDYAVVAKLLTTLASFCERHNLTIIGIVHSAKSRKGEEYLNPRERALGSVAWAAYSETMILVEPIAPDAAGPGRRVYLLPRNAPEELFEMSFENGLLQRRNPDTTAPNSMTPSADALLRAWIAQKPRCQPFKFSDAVSALSGLSERTLRRLFANLVASDVIHTTRKGIYYRPAADYLDLNE